MARLMATIFSAAAVLLLLAPVAIASRHLSAAPCDCMAGADLRAKLSSAGYSSDGGCQTTASADVCVPLSYGADACDTHDMTASFAWPGCDAAAPADW